MGLASLIFGLFVAAVLTAILEQSLPTDFGDAPFDSASYDLYMKRLGYFGIACFAWSTAACLTILASQCARFHMLFAHGLIFLSFSLFLTLRASSICQNLESYGPFRTPQERQQFKFAQEFTEYEIIQILSFALFFIVVGLVIFMAALIADRSEEQRQRTHRRQLRHLYYR